MVSFSVSLLGMRLSPSSNPTSRVSSLPRNNKHNKAWRNKLQEGTVPKGVGCFQKKYLTKHLYRKGEGQSQIHETTGKYNMSHTKSTVTFSAPFADLSTCSPVFYFVSCTDLPIPLSSKNLELLSTFEPFCAKVLQHIGTFFRGMNF